MQDKFQNMTNRSDYETPKCSVIQLEEVDVLTASSIFLPMQPLSLEQLRRGYEND